MTEKLHVEELQEASLTEKHNVLVLWIIESHDRDRHSPSCRFPTIHDLNVDQTKYRFYAAGVQSPQRTADVLVEGGTYRFRDSSPNHHTVRTGVEQAEEEQFIGFADQMQRNLGPVEVGGTIDG